MEFKSAMTYTAKHKPTGETWVILGVNVKRGEVCAARWPPSIGKLRDCKNFKQRSNRTPSEADHMVKNFGENWN
jgi:hypothetical protein